MKYSFLYVILIGLFSSCYTTPASTIAPNTDLSKYKFAAIGTKTTGSNVVLADTQMKVQNGLISCGYNVIIDSRISTLDYDERIKLFFVEFSITSNSSESVCLIYFTDYITGNIIATFRGSFGLGWNMAGDQRGAVDSAIKQMVNSLQNN